MLLPFRFGLGATVGSGRQFMSWIHRDDWVALVGHIIGTDERLGRRELQAQQEAPNRLTSDAQAASLTAAAYNFTAPAPVRCVFKNRFPVKPVEQERKVCYVRYMGRLGRRHPLS